MIAGSDLAAAATSAFGGKPRACHFSLVEPTVGAAISAAVKNSPAANQPAASRQPAARTSRWRCGAGSIVVARAVLGAVVRRFLRDGDVMWMTLPYSCRGDLDEPSFRA